MAHGTEIEMKLGALRKMGGAGALAVMLVAGGATCLAQANGGHPGGAVAQPDADNARIAAIPIERLVTATCRQAWKMGGRNQDGFFDVVQRLTDLAAKNRGVTLPDDKAAGARAGQWIRTQALKDPDQLLYAVVDHAVQYSIAKGHATATNAGASKQE